MVEIVKDDNIAYKNLGQLSCDCVSPAKVVHDPAATDRILRPQIKYIDT
jgi:hypothetical protein